MDDQAMDKKVSILIVDDEALIRDNLASLLERSGFKVAVAVDGQDALTKLSHVGADLIVLDVMMENMWAGYDVNQKLKFQSGEDSIRKVPIVMVSSIEEPPAARFARSAESVMITPDAYLTKPLDVRGFLDTVRSLTQK